MKEIHTLIGDQVEALKESVKFYRPGNQWELDRWVVDSFLRNCGVSFDVAELVQPDRDPPDALFGEARFEVKEVLDPGRRRHAEYKALLELAQAAATPDELLSVYTPRDLDLSQLLTQCEVLTTSLIRKYPEAVRASLDLLIYVNLKHIEAINADCALDSQRIASHGWRSVSFVKGFSGGCICTTFAAPDFIRSIAGRVEHWWAHEAGI